MKKIVIEKSQRLLTLLDESGAPVFSCRAALGREPLGPKRAEGDGRTPEGAYRVCLVKEKGKYGRSLGLSYPSARDAEQAFREGRIEGSTKQAVLAAEREGRRPPWGTPLGGEIYLHEGGSASDWTQGCIALDSADMDALFPLRGEIGEVLILP